MTHPNDVPTYNLTPADMEQVFARTTEQLVADREARQRAAEWPGLVERALASLVGGMEKRDQQLAAIDARLAKLEAAMGLSAG